MRVNQPVSQTNVAVQNATGLGGAKAASTICMLAGIWFFISPWIYGAYQTQSAWNSWIVGAAVFLFGVVRMGRPAYSSLFSWFNMVLGIWAFCSPWIFGYVGNTGRFINSLCVGVIVFAFAIASARISNRSNTTLPTA